MIIAKRIILRSTGRYDRSYKAKKEPPPVSNFFKLIVFLFHWLSTNVSYSAEPLEDKKTEWQDTIRNKGDSIPLHSVQATVPCTHNCTNMNVVPTQIHIDELHIEGNNMVNFGDGNHIESGDQLRTDAIAKEDQKAKIDSIVKALVNAINVESISYRKSSSDSEKQISSLGERIFLKFVEIIVYFLLALMIRILIIIGIRKKWFVKSTLLTISKFLDSIKKWML